MNVFARYLFVSTVAASSALAASDYSVTDIVDAAKRGDGHAVHTLLEVDPANAQITDAQGYTALHWASIRGHWRIVSELVEAGAPVNAVGSDGGTPLHWACHHDQPEMINLLIDNGADLDVANRWGRTPLHIAARRGCTGTAEVLLTRGADPNPPTNEGWTPLHVAALADHPEATRILLAHGADPDLRDHDGRLAAEVARFRPAAVTVDAETLGEFVGIYDLGGHSTAKVWFQGGQLRMREFAPDTLYPIGPDEFFCLREPWRVSFGRSESGEIDEIRIDFLRRSVTGIRMISPQYVGSGVCRGCHISGDHGGPWVSWLRSRHAHAYWRLAGDWALYLARLRPQYADLEQPKDDQRCLLCHVSGLQDDDALMAEGYRPSEGVGCEACHGPGSRYIDPEIMMDRDRFLANGGIVPTADTCRSCHRRLDRFDFQEWWPRIAHGAPED